MPAFAVASQVRDYLNEQGLTGAWSDEQISSNIRTASANLQRWTRRQFEAETATKRFTTYGRAILVIPDLRTATSVSKDGAALVADESYWLVPDRYDQTVHVGVQLRVIDRYTDQRWYLSDPNWWDKGLDSWSRDYSSLPNDLSITGAWGWEPVPDPVQHAAKVLAGWYTLRPSSLLADVRVTSEGAILAYRSLPHEVTDFVTDWTLGEQAVVV